MKEIKFGYVDAETLSNELHEILYELSPCKNEDGGFSFLVPLDYLLSYKNDFLYELHKRDPKDPIFLAIDDFIQILQEQNLKALFVCNDTDMQL